jgi:hypothetical protein
VITYSGIPRNRRQGRASISWSEGRLIGDKGLILDALDMARFIGDLSEAETATKVLERLFRPGTMVVTGDKAKSGYASRQ